MPLMAVTWSPIIWAYKSWSAFERWQSDEERKRREAKPLSRRLRFTPPRERGGLT